MRNALPMGFGDPAVALQSQAAVVRNLGSAPDRVCVLSSMNILPSLLPGISSGAVMLVRR